MVEMTMVGILFTIMGVAGLALLGLVVWTIIEVEAMKRSTHQVQFVPIEKTDAFEELDAKKKAELLKNMGLDDLFEDNI